MSLKDLIEKLEIDRLAKANPAKDGEKEAEGLAALATLALATGQKTDVEAEGLSHFSQISHSQAPTVDQVAERIEAWLRITDNPPLNATKAWKDLADETSDFALSVWAYPAIMTGWSDGALFAFEEGLIPEKLRRRFHWMKIDADAATVMTGRGEIEHFRRPRTFGEPWWSDQRVAVHQNTSARLAKKGNRS
jgi:hypothetical protein